MRSGISSAGFTMPKFMIHASYTAEGAKGLLKSSGSARRKAVEDSLATLGGKLEAFYFMFGEDDALIIMEVPDQVDALAVSMAVGASGMVRSKTTVLIPVEDVDRAIERHVPYRGPGE